MKMNKKTLATVVMGALLTPIFGGVYATTDLPSENFEVTGNVTHGTYDNNGTFTWTKKNQEDKGANQGDIIFIPDGNNFLKIKNLDSLSFKEELDSTTAKQSVDAALKASNGATVDINVKNINFGTKDQVLKADQGLHAFGSTITVNADNIYGNVRGSGFLTAQSVVDNSNTVHKGKLNVHANQDINLTSNYKGLLTAGIYQNTPGENDGTINSLTAGGKINLQVIGENAKGTGVINILDNYRGNYGNGNAQLNISGDQGVNIFSEQGLGVINLLGSSNKNKGAISIESPNGDVSIQTNQQAIYSKNTTDNSVEIHVNGANINVVSKERTAIQLNKNSNVQLSTNREHGTILISGGNGVAADIKGNETTLNIGDGKHATTVELQGQIQVADSGAVTVADKTTTVVDASSLGANPLVSITNGGKFEANENAKLVIKGADTGTSLYAKDNAIAFWNVNNTSFDNPFQYLSDDGTVKAGITASNKNSLAGYLAPLVGIAATGANDKTLTPLLHGADSWNGAVGIGQAAGIQHSTYAVTGLFTDALTDHENTPEKDLWAKGFHSKEDIDGLGFGGGALSLDTQYNGTVVGMDVYQKNGTTAGVAIAYADGNISSSRGTVYTKNDATYLGSSLYGLKDLGSYRLAADLSYVGGSHDITQYNGSQVITAKPDTEAWTLGVKAMKDYTVGQGLLTPYVGLRYLRLTTDKYTSSAGFSYDKETQDLCLLPVGVDYSLQMNRGSWTLKPYAGLSYIWTMGDRNANQTVTYGTATDGFAYDVSDAGSFLGKLGLSASKGDYSFGVGYAYQNGSTTDSHTWTVQASYAF